MPSDPPTGFVRVGRVGKPHGLDGSFVVEGASEDPATFARRGRALGRRRARTRDRGEKGPRAARRPPRPARSARPAADRPYGQLPPPAQDSYYVFQLVGLEVEEEGGRALGRVADVAPGVANDVLELDSGLALPMVEDCISRVDLAAGKIVIARGFADDLH